MQGCRPGSPICESASSSGLRGRTSVSTWYDDLAHFGRRWAAGRLLGIGHAPRLRCAGALSLAPARACIGAARGRAAVPAGRSAVLVGAGSLDQWPSSRPSIPTPAAHCRSSCRGTRWLASRRAACARTSLARTPPDIGNGRLTGGTSTLSPTTTM